MKLLKTHAEQKSGTVLIVDDDLDDVQFTQRVIAAVCPELHIKGLLSGEELICYLRGDDGYADRTIFPYPTLILLDLRMPGMHGFDVLGWLRQHPPHHLVPVVVMTASGEVMVAQQAYMLGARSFLTKPIRATEFQETMVTLR